MSKEKRNIGLLSSFHTRGILLALGIFVSIVLQEYQIDPAFNGANDNQEQQEGSQTKSFFELGKAVTSTFQISVEFQSFLINVLALPIERNNTFSFLLEVDGSISKITKILFGCIISPNGP